jgi:hypothetical protein
VDLRFVLTARRIIPVFVLAAVAGFLLGGCGGGERAASLTTATDRTVTRTAVTATRPTLTDTEDAAATTTGEAATVEETTAEDTTIEETETEPTTTSEPETTTVVTTQTVATTVEPETTTEETPTETVPTETVEPVSSSDENTAWGWIALLIAAAVAILIGLVLWSRHRAGASSWSGAYADLRQRALVQLDLVLAQGSVVTGQVQALADEARRLESRAPDARARAAVVATRGRLDELARTLESDRALRLASPAPSEEQLSYSQALIRNQVLQLQEALRPPPAPGSA